jgi:hypothetical protein
MTATRCGFRARHAQGGDRQAKGQICPLEPPQPLVSKKEAAKKLNVSEKSVKRATAVKKADPAVVGQFE